MGFVQKGKIVAGDKDGAKKKSGGGGGGLLFLVSGNESSSMASVLRTTAHPENPHTIPFYDSIYGLPGPSA